MAGALKKHSAKMAFKEAAKGLGTAGAVGSSIPAVKQQFAEDKTKQSTPKKTPVNAADVRRFHKATEDVEKKGKEGERIRICTQLLKFADSFPEVFKGLGKPTLSLDYDAAVAMKSVVMERLGEKGSRPVFENLFITLVSLGEYALEDMQMGRAFGLRAKGLTGKVKEVFEKKGTELEPEMTELHILYGHHFSAGPEVRMLAKLGFLLKGYSLEYKKKQASTTQVPPDVRSKVADL